MKVKYENLGTENYDTVTLSKTQAWLNGSDRMEGKLYDMALEFGQIRRGSIVAKAISRPLNGDCYNKELGKKAAIDKADENAVKRLQKKLISMVKNLDKLKEELNTAVNQCDEKLAKIGERRKLNG